MENYIVLTLVNSLKKSKLGKEQKNRSVRHGDSRAEKVTLAHRVRKI